jgi:hypothetical protein
MDPRLLVVAVLVDRLPLAKKLMIKITIIIITTSLQMVQLPREQAKNRKKRY